MASQPARRVFHNPEPADTPPLLYQHLGFNFAIEMIERPVQKIIPEDTGKLFTEPAFEIRTKLLFTSDPFWIQRVFRFPVATQVADADIPHSIKHRLLILPRCVTHLQTTVCPALMSGRMSQSLVLQIALYVEEQLLGTVSQPLRIHPTTISS